MSSDRQQISLDINPAVKRQKGDVYPFVDMQSVEAGNKYIIASQEKEFRSVAPDFFLEIH